MFHVKHTEILSTILKGAIVTVHKICRDPENKHVTTPMIFTFAFSRYEYWCPVCGHKIGMFGPAITMQENPKMTALEKAYLERAMPFLKYRSSLSGGMVEDENGRLVPVEAEKVDYEYGQTISIIDAMKPTEVMP